eukprot:6214369-Pleurochrysis_carterae.AAC.2
MMNSKGKKSARRARKKRAALIDFMQTIVLSAEENSNVSDGSNQSYDPTHPNGGRPPFNRRCECTMRLTTRSNSAKHMEIVKYMRILWDEGQLVCRRSHIRLFLPWMSRQYTRETSLARALVVERVSHSMEM